MSNTEIRDNIVIDTLYLKKATMAESEDFKRELFSFINEGKYFFVIDLSECEFIDSTFLSVLVLALKEVKKHNGEMAIVVVNPDVEALLDVTGLKKVFRVYGQLAAALTGVREKV